MRAAHIEVGRAHYSVPYRFVGQCVDVHLTAQGATSFTQKR
ncbi:MAG: Mu transposase domain-containing protein [bacterium]